MLPALFKGCSFSLEFLRGQSCTVYEDREENKIYCKMEASVSLAEVAEHVFVRLLVLKQRGLSAKILVPERGRFVVGLLTVLVNIDTLVILVPVFVLKGNYVFRRFSSGGLVVVAVVVVVLPTCGRWDSTKLLNMLAERTHTAKKIIMYALQHVRFFLYAWVRESRHVLSLTTSSRKAVEHVLWCGKPCSKVWVCYVFL